MHDWSGRPITVGCLVLYAGYGGGANWVTQAQVLAITDRGRLRVLRLSQHRYNKNWSEVVTSFAQPRMTVNVSVVTVLDTPPEGDA